MEKDHQCKVVIQDGGRGGAQVEIPFDVEGTFGKKRVKVLADIEGEPYRGSRVRMGGSSHPLGILKEIQGRIWKDIGDEFEVTVQEDTEPRALELPQDLIAVFQRKPQAGDSFQKLPYSRQKEYARWIQDTKRDETWQRRIEGTVEWLIKGLTK